MVRVLCPIKCLSFYESILTAKVTNVVNYGKEIILNTQSSVISDKKSSYKLQISILKAILFDGRLQTHIR